MISAPVGIRPPLISVVIATFDRPGPLVECLGSLAAIQEKFDWEVIVVDDGSPQPLPPLPEMGVPLQVLKQSNQGPAAARNAGAAVAGGRFLLFLDDDCVAASCLLQNYQRLVELDPTAIWGGEVVTPDGQNVFCQAAQAILNMVLETFNGPPGPARFFPSNNLLVPRQTFLELGGFFSPCFRAAGAEDRELCDRWLHEGLRIFPAVGARVYHQPALSLAAFARMYFRYGRGAFHYHRIRHQRASGKIWQEMSLHRNLPALLPRQLEQFAWKERFLLVFLLLVWQLCNAAGFFWEMGCCLVNPSRRSVYPATRRIPTLVQRC